MDLTKLTQDEKKTIEVTTNFDVDSFVKEYHEDKSIGYLPLGKDGKSAKTTFYFLRADGYASCNVLIKGKSVNLGDGNGMQVLCSLNFVGRNEVYLYFVFYIKVLENKLHISK